MTVLTGDKHPNGYHGMATVLLDPAVSPFPPLSSLILLIYHLLVFFIYYF
jgi:hypothetical protein